MSPDSLHPIPLPLDGERFVPDGMHGNIELEHRHRYVFASQFVSGKVVLDIASGEGYGSALLAKSAGRVIGVDIAEAAVQHAKQRYQAENLEYTTGSCAAIPLGDGAVGVVVSFETIEHHAEHEAMMREINRVLRPGGLLVISSPDKLEYSDKPSFRNPFHVKELYKEEFQALLSTHFRNVRLFGQRVVLGSMLLGEQRSQEIRFQRHESEPASASEDLEPGYWVAIASDDPLPDAIDSIYEHPAAAFWGTLDQQQRNTSTAKVIRVIAASGSEELRGCLQGRWYLQQNPDLVAAGVDPYEHWIASGAQEGRLPSSDPVSLVEELLREREQLAHQDLQSRQERLIQTREQLESQLRHSADRERLSEQAREEWLEQRTFLQAEVARVQSEAGAKIESQLRELAEREKTFATQLLQQQETFESQRAQFADVTDRRLAALASQSGERERSLRQEMQSLQERLQQTQRQSREILEQTQREADARVQQLQQELQQQQIFLQEERAQARRETRVEVERHLQGLAQREQAFAGQLLLQQEKFDSERAALSEALEQRRIALAQEHIEREHQLRQDIRGLQERLRQTENQSREALDRVQREAQERLEQAQKQSREQQTALQEEVARARREDHEHVESQLRQLAERERAVAEQLAQQQAGIDAERARLALATDQKLAALAAQYADRERQLRHDLQCLQESLDRTQREAGQRAESQLQYSVEREQAFASQLLQQQGDFNTQLATLATEFGNRDLRLRQDLLELQERSEIMMAEDRSLLRAQYSSVLADLKRDLEILQTSMSWRLAAPIRAIAAAFGSKGRLPQVRELEGSMHLPLSRDRNLRENTRHLVQTS